MSGEGARSESASGATDSNLFVRSVIDKNVAWCCGANKDHGRHAKKGAIHWNTNNDQDGLSVTGLNCCKQCLRCAIKMSNDDSNASEYRHLLRIHLANLGVLVGSELKALPKPTAKNCCHFIVVPVNIGAFDFYQKLRTLLSVLTLDKQTPEALAKFHELKNKQKDALELIENVDPCDEHELIDSDLCAEFRSAVGNALPGSLDELAVTPASRVR